MIAIHTKFIGPSNTQGARIKAYTVGTRSIPGFSVTIPYPNADAIPAHFQAVQSLVEKYGLDWDVQNMRYGDSSDGKGFSFCFDKSKVTS